MGDKGKPLNFLSSRPLKETARKRYFFSGQSTKTFSPPPPRLSGQKNFFFVLKKPETDLDNFFSSDNLTQYTNINIWLCRLKKNILNFSMATNLSHLVDSPLKKRTFFAASLSMSNKYCDCDPIIYVYVTAGMDISAGSVPPGPNLTGGMEPGMKTNI